MKDIGEDSYKASAAKLYYAIRCGDESARSQARDAFVRFINLPFLWELNPLKESVSLYRWRNVCLSSLFLAFLTFVRLQWSGSRHRSRPCMNSFSLLYSELILAVQTGHLQYYWNLRRCWFPSRSYHKRWRLRLVQGLPDDRSNILLYANFILAQADREQDDWQWCKTYRWIRQPSEWHCRRLR